MLFKKITLILLILLTSILAVDRESRKIHISDTIELANSNHADGGYKVTKIRWLENGKVMIDIDGSLMDSPYKRYSYYKPTLEGRHTYTRETTKRLDDSKGRPYNKIYTKIIHFDVFGLDQEILELKTKPYYAEITLGQEFTLEGIVTKGSLNNVAEYSWSENNIILKDTQGKDIVYHDNANRWHEYKATAIGKHDLYFTVKDINGYKYKIRMILTVKDNYAGLLVDAGKDKNITSDKIIRLGTNHSGNNNALTVNGTVLRGDKGNIKRYSWSEKGKELASYGTAGTQSKIITLGLGQHTLKFSAHHDNGETYQDTMILSISSNDNSVILLDAGKNQTIQLGKSIILNGKIVKGDKSEITEYAWSEKSKILKNLLDDPIFYNNDENRENDYKPNKIGKHTLTFSALHNNGKYYHENIIITVTPKANPTYKLKVAKKMTITLGEMITLNAKVTKGNKNNIETYLWEESDKILNNAVGDAIEYIDYENRDNDYIPTTIGKHILTFKIITKMGKVYTKRRTIIVKKH